MKPTVPSQPILVISPDWQTRALLAAQLGELSDRDVISTQGANEALALVKAGGVDPALLVVDAGQEMSRSDVKRLMEAHLGAPLVLTVSALRQKSFDALKDRCAAYLVRPISIGRIAKEASSLVD